MKHFARILVVVTVLAAFFALTVPACFAEDELVMGIIPAENPDAMVKQYTPMANWLAQKMGVKIKIITATDYTGVVEAMRAKKVDIAWFGPFSYVMANERAGAEAVAVGMDKNGVSTYNSYLVTTPENAKEIGFKGIEKGEEGMKNIFAKLMPFKGKISFTFTDPASTSGYAIPRYYMYLTGNDPKDIFKSTGFVGTHDAAELVVKNKIIQMASDNNINYAKMEKAGLINKKTNIIIWESPALPGSPLAIRSDEPQKIKDDFRKYIKEIPKDIVTGYGEITGYDLVTDADFKVIKDVKKVIDGLK
jgi:phosphonate transport system substrate-binding protein